MKLVGDVLHVTIVSEVDEAVALESLGAFVVCKWRGVSLVGGPEVRAGLEAVAVLEGPIARVGACLDLRGVVWQDVGVVPAGVHVLVVDLADVEAAHA